MYPMTPLQGNDCQCTACGTVFIGLDAFDLHQLWSDDGETLTCLDPVTLGFICAGREPVWGRPNDAARRQSAGLRLETARQNRRSQTPENGHFTS